MRNRNHFIGLWLDDKEYSNLINQCEITGLTASSLVRQLLQGVALRPRPPDEYSTLLRELSAIGNNINQIAHWANKEKSIHEAEIVEAAVLAKEAWRMVKDTL